jgi:hypothetical protein
MANIDGTTNPAVRGDIFLNGNVMNEADLIGMTWQHVVKPQTFRDELNESRKVLLVTAAWQRGHEFNDRHIIRHFEDLGINADWQNGFPGNIQNLGLYSAFAQFIQAQPDLYAIYHQKQKRIKAVKRDYFIANQEHTTLLFKDFKKFKSIIPALGLFDLFYSIKDEMDLDFFTRDLDLDSLNGKVKGIRKLQRTPKAKKLALAIRNNLEEMIAEDQVIYQECQDIEQSFFKTSGILNCDLYLQQQSDMQQRILSSATVYLFGGRVYVLNNRLRFYQLGSTFAEALNQGSNLYGISAGSIVMTDNFALNFEKHFRGGFLRAEDSGMGLAKNLWVFPHANDYRYITKADENTLSFFALRHFPDICVGLSANSILRCERYLASDGKEYDRYTSYGHDPVLVFGVRGRKQQLQRGDQIAIKGTRFYRGENMIYTHEEIMRMERMEEMGELQKLGVFDFHK